MKKRLLTENIANELEGASLFFTRPASPPPGESKPLEQQSSPVPDSPAPSEHPMEKGEPLVRKNSKPTKKEQTDNRDTTIPRYHDTTVSRYHDTTTPEVYGVAIEVVRKAVKEFGKEAATHRFTANEKKEIADLIYTYKSRSIKTSENEIARIAINFIIEDYRENGEGSVLHKILAALNE